MGSRGRPPWFGVVVVLGAVGLCLVVAVSRVAGKTSLHHLAALSIQHGCLKHSFLDADGICAGEDLYTLVAGTHTAVPFSTLILVSIVRTQSGIRVWRWLSTRGRGARDHARRQRGASGGGRSRHGFRKGRQGADFIRLLDDAYAWGAALQKNGKIVLAGTSNKNFALARYTNNGTLDKSFGRGGKVLTKFGSSSLDGARAVAIEKNGKIVAVGVRTTRSLSPATRRAGRSIRASARAGRC